MSEYHIPVLLDESVSALIDSTSGTYADATFGGGGHSREILSRLSASHTPVQAALHLLLPLPPPDQPLPPTVHSEHFLHS